MVDDDTLNGLLAVLTLLFAHLYSTLRSLPSRRVSEKVKKGQEGTRK